MADRFYAPANFQFDFDRLGPSLGPVRLLSKSALGFRPVPKDVLEERLVEVFGRNFDCRDLCDQLHNVCRALDAGDVFKAAFSTQFLRLPPAFETADGLIKASPEDPEHPGWPKGTADGKGGEYRPVDGDGPTPLDRQRIKDRYSARKSLRSVFRRVLTTKRALRLISELAGDAVPGIDEMSAVATVADGLQFARDLAQDVADSQTALDFVERGPRTVEQLAVSEDNMSFPSYSAFQKVDVEKYFGRAGDDMQYHHIVEQGPNAGLFSSEQLNSTSNIIRLPKLIHEDVTSVFNTKFDFETGKQTLRDFVRGKPFDQQRVWGLWALQQAGVIH